MAVYELPVSRLLEIGRPELGNWEDYSQYGIGTEHIPDLIRMLRDSDLMWQVDEDQADDDDEEEDKPHYYAYIHAWRALGQLKAEAAIEPLLDMIVEDDASDDFNDWITEEVPDVLAMIGLPALAPTAERLVEMHFRPHAPGSFAQALEKIGNDHPEARPQVIAHLVAFLDRARQNDAAQNGFVISSLIHLKAVEAWPAIERAFVSGSVDPTIAGAVDRVKFKLGLGPEPPRRLPPIVRARKKMYHPSAKNRADERARKRKAEKRKQKRRR
jgi:hypothetical protein